MAVLRTAAAAAGTVTLAPVSFAALALAVRSGTGWLPAIGNSDAHSEPQVIGLPHTVVEAASLERGALLDGLRAGRSWLAESSAVDLALTVTGGGHRAGIGGTLTVPRSTPVDVSLQVSGVPNGVVRLLTDEGQMHQESLPTSGPGGDGVRELPFGPVAAMTNPVFLRGR